MVVGLKPGPRVSVVGALRGFETTAALAAARLAAGLDPAALMGSVVIVPVLRPGGPAVAHGPSAAAPGVFRATPPASGRRATPSRCSRTSSSARARWSCSGVPRRGRRGAVVVHGRLTDPRVRRLARGSGATAMFAAPPKSHGLLAAAAAARIPGRPAVRRRRRADGRQPGAGGPRGDRRGRRARRGPERAADRRAAPRSRPPWRASLRVEAAIDGFLETDVAPGDIVQARVPRSAGWCRALPGPPAIVATRADGLVVEAARPGPVRAGATLFVLLPVPRAAAERRLERPRPEAIAAGSARSDGKMRVGWVEYVALPSLDIDHLKAKIDTGARTSALHVARMRTVDTTGGPHRRPILEITVPSGGRGRLPHRVRAAVHGFVMVRDTSGRTERRPVIETTLRLGTLKRRIAVTLTNRGDMLFPMLIGRTALGPGIVVDPSRRYLLGRRARTPASRVAGRIN